MALEHREGVLELATLASRVAGGARQRCVDARAESGGAPERFPAELLSKAARFGAELTGVREVTALLHAVRSERRREPA